MPTLLLAKYPRLVATIARCIALRAVRSLSLWVVVGCIGVPPQTPAGVSPLHPDQGDSPWTQLFACAKSPVGFYHRSPHSPAGCSLAFAMGCCVRHWGSTLTRAIRPGAIFCLRKTPVSYCHRSPHSPAGFSLAFAMGCCVMHWGLSPKTRQGFHPCTLTRAIRPGPSFCLPSIPGWFLPPLAA